MFNIFPENLSYKNLLCKQKNKYGDKESSKCLSSWDQ